MCKIYFESAFLVVDIHCQILLIKKTSSSFQVITGAEDSFVRGWQLKAGPIPTVSTCHPGSAMVANVLVLCSGRTRYWKLTWINHGHCRLINRFRIGNSNILLRVHAMVLPEMVFPFFAVTKLLYEWFCPSVCLSVHLSVRLLHLFHHVPIIISSWNFQKLLPSVSFLYPVWPLKCRPQLRL